MYAYSLNTNQFNLIRQNGEHATLRFAGESSSVSSSRHCSPNYWYILYGLVLHFRRLAKELKREHINKGATDQSLRIDIPWLWYCVPFANRRYLCMRIIPLVKRSIIVYGNKCVVWACTLGFLFIIH